MSGSNLTTRLVGKLKEAEHLAEQIKMLPKGSEQGNDAILRWAVLGDECQKLMLQAEEQLAPAQLFRLKAQINGSEPGACDMWAKYRESKWRLPQFGGPGPSDEPPRMSLGDLLQ